ncbi:MAG TPA: DUF6527 family protein [Terriglobales bacterium]|nr:DUF6527 family protein [Terriglobales bacterium]
MIRTKAKKIRYRGTVETRDTAQPLLLKSGDAVIVERGKPRLLILRCPCGCGDDLIVNLDRRAGAAWHFYRSRKGLTLFPSYWREDRCGSHFILWNNQIYWCYGWESDESDRWQVSAATKEKVYALLTDEYFVDYAALAEQLDLIPWEALQACRQLAKEGRAIADEAPRNGMYQRIDARAARRTKNNST